MGIFKNTIVERQDEDCSLGLVTNRIKTNEIAYEPMMTLRFTPERQLLLGWSGKGLLSLARPVMSHLLGFVFFR